MVVTGGSREGEELARRLYKVHGIPTYTLLERAVNAASALYRAGIEPCTSEWRPGPREPACPEAGWLRDDEALRIAAEAGIPVPKYCYAGSPEEAADCYRRLGARKAVVKLASSRIKHKSDVGGVVLGVESPQEAARAYRLIEERLEERGLSQAFEGVVVMEMVEDGIEVFVGARWDPSFGPVVAFGGGGIFVELYRDVSVRIAPLTRCEAMRMIGETRIGSALTAGYRGLEGDVGALVDLLVGVSRLLATGRLVEADLNPVIVGRSGVRAVDVKIRGCL